MHRSTQPWCSAAHNLDAVESLPVEDQVDDLLADGVVAPGVVVGRILLPSHQLLGVEQLTVGPSPDLHRLGMDVMTCFANFETKLNEIRLLIYLHLIDNRWFQVDKDSPKK